VYRKPEWRTLPLLLPERIPADPVTMSDKGPVIVVQVAKKGKKVIPEVMIPLILSVQELEHQKAIVKRVADEVLAKAGLKKQKYLIGTMIEIPRAALLADQVAKEAEFFSFGTNDLTQTTMGLSRDDYTKFSKD
jgi:pyruvate, orthophosphate dikinase